MVDKLKTKKCSNHEKLTCFRFSGNYWVWWDNLGERPVLVDHNGHPHKYPPPGSGNCQAETTRKSWSRYGLFFRKNISPWMHVYLIGIVYAYLGVKTPFRMSNCFYLILIDFLLRSRGDSIYHNGAVSVERKGRGCFVQISKFECEKVLLIKGLDILILPIFYLGNVETCISLQIQSNI